MCDALARLAQKQLDGATLENATSAGFATTAKSSARFHLTAMTPMKPSSPSFPSSPLDPPRFGWVAQPQALY